MASMEYPPICPYCGVESSLVNGTAIYPHRPDLAKKLFYRCKPCNAYVGCHPKTTTALGTLAGPALRMARQAAHAAFDPHFRFHGSKRRGEGYRWIQKRLGLTSEQAHIGSMDEATCWRVVEACRELR